MYLLSLSCQDPQCAVSSCAVSANIMLERVLTFLFPNLVPKDSSSDGGHEQEMGDTCKPLLQGENSIEVSVPLPPTLCIQIYIHTVCVYREGSIRHLPYICI